MMGEEGYAGRRVRGSGRGSGTSRRWLLLGLISLVVMLTRWGALEAREGPNELRITSAADFSRSAPLAPESLATAFGTRLATKTAVAEGHPLPTTLEGTTVRVQGVAAPLTYVSPERVNFQIPAGLPAGEATITVTAGDGTVAQGVTRLAPVSPGLFAANFEVGEGEAGEEVYLVLYGTGIRGRGKPEDVRVIIGGIPLPVAYADAQQGYAGLDQINVKLPESMLVELGRMEAAVSIQTDGPDGLIISNHLTIDAGESPDLNVTAPWQSIILSRRPTRKTPSNALRLVRRVEITSVPLESVTAGSAIFIHGVSFAPEARGNLVWVGDLEAVVERATSTQLVVRVPYGAEATSVRVKTSQAEATSADLIKLRSSLSGLVMNTEKKPIANLQVELLRTNDSPVMTVTTDPNGVFLFPAWPDGPDGPDLEAGNYLVRFNGEASVPPLPYPRITSKTIVVNSNKDSHHQMSTLPEISQATSASREVSTTASPLSLAEDGLGFELPSNTTATFPTEGTSQRLTLSRVKESLPPTALPAGWLSREVAQITPIGTKFSQGGKLVFPNLNGYPVDEVVDLYRLEQNLASPNIGQFIKVGTAKVTAGGKIETEPNAIEEASLYLVAKLQPARTVKGTVVAQRDNRPVSMAQVSAGGRQTWTDKDGKFELGDVQVGPNETLTVEAILVQGNGSIARAQETEILLGPDGTLPQPLVLKIEQSGRPARRVLPGFVALNFKTASVNPSGVVTSSQGTPRRQYLEELEEGVHLEMVEIPGGTFKIGSPEAEVGRFIDEGPPTDVTIPSFVIGKYEVTQQVWRAVAALPKVARDLSADPARFKGVNLPIEQVSGEDVIEFLARLNTRLGLTGKNGYRLPSEAEWEYAARAGTTTPFSFGATINTDIANYYGPDSYGEAPVGVNRGRTVEVGSLGVANAWGLFDIHGNVWEMCEDDWYDDYTRMPVDGSARVNSTRAETRVIRGGSWYSSAVDCRSAYRSRSLFSNRLETTGFRLARTLPIDVPIPNRDPQLTVPGAQTTRVGLPLTFEVSATDPDPGQTLTLTATAAGGSLPAGATFTAPGRIGAFAWTPASDQVGSYTISFTVMDSGTPALSTTKTVTITVMERQVWVPLDFTTATVDADGVVTRTAGIPTRQYDEDLGGGVKLEMVEIAGGTFTMGSPASEAGRSSSEGPPREVNVNGFVIGKYEVTQAQWRAVMGTNPSRFRGNNLPVEQVSWEQAQEFCRRLNLRLGLSGSTAYRLPSEAEWEYAARAGTTTPFAFGPTINAEIVNYDALEPYGNAPKASLRNRPVDVGSLGVANARGLYDMHGNVWEWVEDDWHDNYNGAPVDGRAWVETLRGADRPLRGGGWDDAATSCRSAYRGKVSKTFHNNDIGFRLARTLP